VSSQQFDLKHHLLFLSLSLAESSLQLQFQEMPIDAAASCLRISALPFAVFNASETPQRSIDHSRWQTQRANDIAEKARPTAAS
jgi:hypothetical protein